MKKLIRLRKKLSVNVLSLIMATGLLLLVVPFVAIASGKEGVGADTPGSFRLYKGLFATTQVILNEDSPEFVMVSVQLENADSYQWQAYSAQEEKYVDLEGRVGAEFYFNEELACQYDYGNGKSYFRCHAVTTDGELLTSDVLTVVLPVVETDESGTSQTDDTVSTISTIEILEPTQPEGPTTQPEEPTTQPEEPTTQPEEPTTQEITAPTQPGEGEGEGDPVEGKLLQPLTEEPDGKDKSDAQQEGENEENPDNAPIKGMFLRSLNPMGEPMRDGATAYTVEYYIQNPIVSVNNDNANSGINDDDTTQYELYRTITGNANSGEEVTVSTAKPEGTGIDDYIEFNSGISNITETIAADGSTVFKLYFKRKTYTISFLTCENITPDPGTPMIDGVTWNNSDKPYVIHAKYGANISKKWPDNGNLSRQGNSYFIRGNRRGINYFTILSNSSSKIYLDNPIYLTSDFISKLVLNTNTGRYDYLIHWANLKQQAYTYNYYLMDENGNYPGDPGDPDFITRSSSAITSHPTVDGFERDTEADTQSGNVYNIYYKRKNYKLNYKDVDGTSLLTAIDVRYGKTLGSPENQTPTKAYYDFVGWYYDTGFTSSVNWGTDNMPMSDLTIYAKWTPKATTYTVRFYQTEGGTLVDTVSGVSAGATVTATTDITNAETGREGYTFNGWKYKDSSNVEQTFTFGSTPVNANMDVYGTWTANSHSLRFPNTSEAYQTAHNATVPYGTSLSSYQPAANEEPTKEGYDFDGWYSNEACTTPMNWSQTMPDEDVNVYAKWRVKTFGVRFYWGLDYINSNITIVYNPTPVSYNATFDGSITPLPPATGTLAKLDDRERDSLAFVGWYYDKDNPDNPRNPAVKEAEFTFDETTNQSQPITFAMKIYAKWVPYHKVTFYKDKVEGALTDQLKVINKVNEGATVAQTEAPDPTGKEGYLFDKWCYGDDRPFFDNTGTSVAMGTSDVDVYATWTPIEIDLVIVNGGGDNVFTVTGEGFTTLTLYVPGNGSRTIKHLPYGSYTVTRKKWDYRAFSSATQTVDVTADNTGNTVTLTFGAGTSRNLHWLGNDKVYSFTIS